MSFTQYSPEDVIVLVAGVPCSGVESVVVEFDEDKRSLHMGIDGSGRHVRNLKKSGTVSIELTDYSPSNAALILVDKTDVPVLVSVVDKSSKGTAFVSDNCKLRKIPALSRSAEGGTNEWIFQFVSGELTHGSAKE